MGLDKAHTTGNYTDFIKLITKLEIEMLKKYLELLQDVNLTCVSFFHILAVGNICYPI